MQSTLRARAVRAAVSAAALTLLLSSCAIPDPGEETLETLDVLPKVSSASDLALTVGDEIPTQRAPAIALGNARSMSFSPIWNPPSRHELYQVVDDAHGYPAQGGTKFYLAHSCSSDDSCIGSQILAAEIERGDLLTVAGAEYRVAKVMNTPKNSLPVEYWVHDPERILIITCVQVPGENYSVTNHIVVADRFVS